MTDDSKPTRQVPYDFFLMWTKQAIREGAPNPSAAENYQIPDWQLRVYKQVYEAGLAHRDQRAYLRNEALVEELNKHRGDLDLETFVASLLSLHKTVKAAGGYVVEEVVKQREHTAHLQGRDDGYVEGLQEGRLLGAQYAEVGHLVHQFYDTGALGFHTAESAGMIERYRMVSKFGTLADMQAHHAAWVNLMVFVRDAKEASRAS